LRFITQRSSCNIAMCVSNRLGRSAALSILKSVTTSRPRGSKSSVRQVLSVNLSRSAHLERRIRCVTQPMWSPTERNVQPATHASANEVPDVVVPPESKSRARKASVERDHPNFFRPPSSSRPCSSNRPQRHHRSLASLAASGFPTGIATSTLCLLLKRCATLNKTLPYATKSRKKRR